MSTPMERRDFLRSAVPALSYGRILGANDRIAIGLIGCGIEGVNVATHMREVSGVSVSAVCDVYSLNAEKAKAELDAGSNYKDFRRLLERKDIDAVIVATPDHWHAIPTVLACQAGKDVYVEKPLAHTIVEGRIMVDAARRHNRIVCMGSQQRSAPHIQEAAQMIQNGTLGKVHFVRVWDCGNAFPPGPVPPDADPPAGLDWDFWLGPSPKQPFNEHRWRNWRSFWDQGGGEPTDMGTHWLDTVQQVMAVDAPLSVVSVGGLFELRGAQQVPDLLQVIYEYPGFLATYEVNEMNSFGNSRRTPGREYFYPKGKEDVPHGILFYGTNGTLFLDRYGYEVFPEPAPGRPDRLRAERRQRFDTEPKALHCHHFIACLRTRTAPSADVAIGHRSTTLPHLANIAFKTRKKLLWDPLKEEFPGEPDANRLLSYEMRREYAWI